MRKVSGHRRQRSRAGWIALAVLALACGGNCGRSEAPSPRAAGGAPAVRATAARATAVVPTPAASQSATLSGKVVGILDGDSIVVVAGGAQIEVRLHGVDAPEHGQAYGRRARRFAGELAFGREVRLEPRGKDAYGRTLAEVFLPDGRSLNRELVSAGLAWRYRKYADDADLASREREARATRRGLWADRNPVPPWEFRETRRKR